MSKYTVQLRWPIEQKLNALKLNYSEDNWPNVYGLLGLDDYPIFEESHRKELNTKIIRAYYFREIGFETLGQFRWQMHRMMHEIMPYYNQLYLSEGIITDPVITKNMDYTETWTRDEKIDTSQNETDKRTTDNTANSSSSGASSDKNVFQDTPMNGLDTSAIKNMDYATNVTFDDGTTSSTASSTSKNVMSDTATTKRSEVGDYDGTKKHNEKGFDKDQSELLLNYRKTFLNIDLEIVDRLNVLFMGLW